MWRLFKEVFKSLTKNKVTVIGLSILVFLASAIFTLLSNLRASLVGGFKNYQQVSRLQDVSVDLNLPTQGSAYNQGYYVNNDKVWSNPKDQQENEKPITYFVDERELNFEQHINDEYRKSIRNVLHFQNNDEYIKLEKITNVDPSFKDLYIKRDDLVNFYSVYKADQSSSAPTNDVQFNLGDAVNNTVGDPTFQFNKASRSLVLYDANKKIVTANNVLAKNTTVTFDHDYELNNLLQLNEKDSKLYISQVSALFINVLTKEISADFAKGHSWIDKEIGYQLTPADVAKIFKFHAYNNNNYIFEQDNPSDDLSEYIDYSSNPADKSFRLSLKVKHTWALDNILDSDKTINYRKTITFEKGKAYGIQKDWIAKEESETAFLRWNYYSTFINDSDKWIGEFKTYMQSVKDSNKDLWNKLESFSYWRKQKTTKVVPYDASGQLLNDKASTNSIQIALASSNDHLEIHRLKLYCNDKRINAYKQPYATSFSKTIRDIEKAPPQKLNSDFFNEINNENIRQERFEIIKDKAHSTTRQKIIEQIQDIVKAENIGLRETMTIDGINEKTGKQNTFHFINTGDENNVIDGVKMNVGKLFDETQNKSILNSNISNALDAFKTYQLSPYVASLVLQSIGRNLYPDGDYIQPVYNFAQVKDYDRSTGLSKTTKGAKIVSINNYVADNKDGSKTPDYKTLNLGITFVGNRFKLVKKIKNSPELWEVQYPENMPNEGMDRGLLSKWLSKHSYTIATDFIKTNGDGWVKIDKTYENVAYIPLLFLSPKAQLIYDVLNNNKIDYMADAIEKYLLNFDLVKGQFITSEQVYQICQVMKKVMNNNNLASVFATGKMNKGMLPKMMIDFVYELSHYESGDVLKGMLVSILEQCKATIIKKDPANVEKQKAFLVEEVTNLFNLIKDVSSLDISKFVSPEALVHASNNSIVFLDGFSKIINSINLKHFSEEAYKWYDEVKKQPKVTENGVDYYRQLVSGDIINWVFSSVDQVTLKQGLKQIINNLDIAKTIDLNNTKSLLYTILLNKMPSLIDGFKPLMTKIDAKKDKSYSNVKEGLNELISVVDFNILAEELKKVTVRKNIKYNRTKFNTELNKNENETFNVSLDSISPKDGLISFLKSMFKQPGAGRAFKQTLIKTFNLSYKTKIIEIVNDKGEKSRLIVPDKDDDKVSFFDFLGIFASALKPNGHEKEFRNYTIEKDLIEIRSAVDAIDDKNFEILTLKESYKESLAKYGIFNEKDNKTVLLEKINNLLMFINQTKGGIDFIEKDKDKSGSDFINDLMNHKDGNAAWVTLNSLLSSATATPKNNIYALGAQAFSMYMPWMLMYTNKDADFKESNKFVTDFLALSLNADILAIMQEINKDDNIPFVESTNFGLSKVLADLPNSKLFEVEKNGEFKNPQIKNFIANNPKFKQWVLDNKLMLTQQLAFIAASKKYSYSSTKTNGVYYYAINGFIKNYLSTKNFFDLRYQVINLSNVISPVIPVQAFGLSEALVHPVLRALFPEITISYLADQKAKPGSEEGNIAGLLMNKITDLEKLVDEKTPEYKALCQIFEQAFATKDTSLIPLDLKNEETLVMDGAKIDYLTKNKDKESSKIFGINFLDFIYGALNSIVEPKDMKDIVFSNANSYLAKVNYAYLAKNDKAIYTGKIPSNPLELLALIDALDSKFIIDVNGTKFIIIGQDTTVDYMYPVVDENHLMVDTSNQALVYVNKYGFARIHLGYVGNVVKKALLVKNDKKITHMSDNQLKDKITKIVNDSISDSNKLQRVFLTKEIDPVNPERAIRISTVDGLIKAVSGSTVGLMSVLVILVAISTIFIIKRYIDNKNKVLGILVAQGYKPIQIALSLTAFAMVTSLVGGILGYVVGNRAQLLLLNIFSNYWTLQKEWIPFDFFALFFTVFLPFSGMSALIIVVTWISLRHKPVELISNVHTVPTSKTFKVYQRSISKFNVKKRFSFILAWKGFWKLMSFGLSVMLTGIATMFGIANSRVFKDTIDKTYENRHYTFKVDLDSPTIEGGAYKSFYSDDLNNNIYTPLGELNEGNREKADYFKPGYSSVLNGSGKNGNPQALDSHILSQFSVNVNVSAGVAADPWQVAYNGMPDTQKAKIDRIRDTIGYELERTQDKGKDGNHFVIDPITHAMSYVDKDNNKLGFFKYYHSPYEKQGIFKWANYDPVTKNYKMESIATGAGQHRDEFRNFLVKGYKQITAYIDDPKFEYKGINNTNSNDYWLADKANLNGRPVNDYYISFGGVFLDKNHDEPYTYLKASSPNANFKIYGYQKDSKFITLIDKNKNNLYDLLYKYKIKDAYPLVINEVTAKKYHWNIGSKVELQIDNKVDRYANKIYKAIGKEITAEKNPIFEVIAINPTYINNELITTQNVANKLIGFDKLNAPAGYKPFNGVLTNAPTPRQVTDSAGLYSISGYWSGYNGFDLTGIPLNTIKSMFDEIYHPQNGLLAQRLALNQDEIMSFITYGNYKKFDQSKYDNVKETDAKACIERFSSIYENKLYILLGSSIDSKDIEVGFTSQIGDTITQISVAIIALSFIISLIILIIMSTIMISENQKNIAIWSILGYNQREKLKMFFGVYIPFILLAIIISIPIVMLMVYTFNFILLMSSSIALPLALKWWHILVTSLIIFGIFTLTSILTWVSISKMKPVDLLKGK